MPLLLSVRHLSVAFRVEGTFLPVVEEVSFDVEAGETVALVGESGCGKTVTALSLLRLVSPSVGRIEAEAIRFRDRNLLDLTEREMRAVRGGEIAMIFQEPMTSLNPVFRVGDQVAEVVRRHRNVSRKEALEMTVEAFQAVGIPDPRDRLRAFPHELSGGMRQRVMIAMAVVCEPALLIADEPTTALDVTIQAQILDLLRRLQEERGMAIVLITHDLGVVAEMAHRVLVMYAGRIVEAAAVEELFARPRHPYTRGLLESVPSVTEERDRLNPIPGTVPDPTERPPGCAFAPRCTIAHPVCSRRVPSLLPLPSDADGVGANDPAHLVRCFAISDDEGYNKENVDERALRETS